MFSCNYRFILASFILTSQHHYLGQYILVCCFFHLWIFSDRVKFVYITFVLVLFVSVSAASVFSVVMVLLTSIYALIWSYKQGFNTEFLNLFFLSETFTPFLSSVTLTQFFSLNLFNWFVALSNKFIIFCYYIPFMYLYI